MLNRAYYYSSLEKFLCQDSSNIFGELAKAHSFDLEDRQKNSWLYQIEILKAKFAGFTEGHIAFEFSIPRMGKRVDLIFIYKGVIFVIEFKVNAKSYEPASKEQAIDYALDLKNFHEASRSLCIVPILVATDAPKIEINKNCGDDNVYGIQLSNVDGLSQVITEMSKHIAASDVDPDAWLHSRYRPTPTIIEAARALYNGHDVEAISQSEGGKFNIAKTSKAISKVIEDAKKNHRKAICFVTGVPGAGKTLAGLNIAVDRNRVDESEHAVFLSGNGPLVKVLTEALARDKADSDGISKSKARSETKVFIQIIHHFRDDAVQSSEPPAERVAIFDEAQRAWNERETSSFMIRKKGIPDFDKSEPEFLLEVMDRHESWAVIVCLIGGGQEINRGEAGLEEWLKALKNRFVDWHVHLSDNLSDHEYTYGKDIYDLLKNHEVLKDRYLHLATSVRSFRSENVSEFVKALLDLKADKCLDLMENIAAKYPVLLTRELATAKQWLKSRARGSERKGLLATSGAIRLKPHGIFVKCSSDPVNYFLEPQTDIRSSCYLEDVATEFDVQGLELDWTCVAWDADLRIRDGKWEYWRFRGSRWQTVKQVDSRRYLLNAYRVLLTRARQGMIIFVPPGNDEDHTRPKSFYDETYSYLKQTGMKCI